MTRPLRARGTAAPAARSLLVGWPLVGWCALAIGLIEATILVVEGAGESGMRMVVRASARTSLVLFAAAFAASSLARLWPAPPTRFLLVNRRYLGVAFAVSHASHLAAIVWLARLSPEFRAGIAPPTVILGGVAYVFVAAMAATSFDRTAAWLGPRRWRLLHLVGGWYVWLIFFLSYLPVGRETGRVLPPFLVVLAVAAARGVARRRRTV
ncbi:MAG: ferric reductase-like transmembrane domain-containing protein [Thermodesulfobacteriota bacterium]